MKVLVIGRDPNLFKPESESYQRIKEYANLFEGYHIVNMAGRGYQPVEDGKLRIWPTNSFFLPLAWLDAVWLGRRLAKKHKLEIVDAQDPAEAGLAAFLVAKLCKIPVRLQIHADIFSPWYRRVSWKEFVRYHLARFLIPHVFCIRVVSERIKKSLIDFGIPNSRIIVLPIFTDIARFMEASRNPETDKRFLEYNFKMIAVGRFVDKEKNFSMLLRVVADLVKIYPGFLLTLVGGGPDKDFYEKEVQNQGLKKSVIIEGWRNDLPSFYKSFDLFLLSSNYEGWGRVVIEAMASGLPVIMTDVGLAGEVIQNQNSGIVVGVGDEKSFRKAILDIREDREKRRILAEKALGVAKGLGELSRAKYFDKYREAMSYCIK